MHVKARCVRWLLASALVLSLMPQQSLAADPTFRVPLQTRPPVNAFLDEDPDPVQKLDFRCATNTYDGHQGTDFGVNCGTPVYAAASGTVIDFYSNCDQPCNPADNRGSDCGKHGIPLQHGGFGNHVFIDHGNGWIGIYAHLFHNSIAVGLGQSVSCGTLIGLSGNTGNSSGDHLHFELRSGASVVDPYAGTCSQPASHWITQTFDSDDAGAVCAVALSTPGASVTPTSGPFYPAQQISGAFTVTNNGSQPVQLDRLTIAGRGPGGSTDVQDFSHDTSAPVLQPGGSYSYSGTKTFPRGGRYSFHPACQIAGAWQNIGTNETTITVSSNVARSKPCYVHTNGAERPGGGHQGEWPDDIVDGDLSYQPVSSGNPDGCIAWVNDDYNELLRVNVVIDLGQTATVTRIRYNMGNCQHADTWGPDWFISPLTASVTIPGTSYSGAWTTHNGSFSGNAVSLVLEKTRTSTARDWLFIGEVEAYGLSSAAQSIQAAAITGANNAHTDPLAAVGSPDGGFVSLGVGGELTLDLGATVPDQPGYDIRVVAVGATNEGYSVIASADGSSWASIGTGLGTATFDIAASGLTEVRYVRVADDGDGDPLSVEPGLDLDAVLMEWTPSIVGVTNPPVDNRTGIRSVWPNPFKDGISFDFNFARPGAYTLHVMDVQGREVWSTSINSVTGGSGRVTWNGADGAGRSVGSGVYFLQVAGAGIRDMRRIVLLR